MVNNYDLQQSGQGVKVTAKDKIMKLDDSVTQYGAARTNFRIKNGFSSASTPDNFLKNNYARKWLYAFGNPVAKWQLKTKTKNIIFDPGDKTTLSFAKEIDMTGASSSVGWSLKKSIITEQKINLSGRGQSVKFDVTYKGLVFDIFDKVSNFHTDDTEILEGDMDDSTLDPTGSNTVALAAAHAFVDFSAGLHTSDAYRFTIQWENPNSGTSHHLFAIALHIQDSVPATIFTVIPSQFIRYFSGDALTIKRTFFCIEPALGSVNVERIKIAAFDLRQTDNSAVTGAEQPNNMKVTSIIRTDLNRTISVV